MPTEPDHLTEWLRTLAAELDLQDVVAPGDIRVVLDLARDAAHAVERPAAPLTTFLVGVAVGRGARLADAAAAAGALAAARAGDGSA